MSLYALLRNAAYRGSLSAADIELDGILDGNLCRCTGYKPILDAAKTFVGEYAGGRGELNSSNSDDRGRRRFRLLYPYQLRGRES